MKDFASNEVGKCPFSSGELSKGAGSGTSNRDWWPNELKLNILRQNASKSNPMGDDFDYVKAFNSIKYEELNQDVIRIMTD